MRGTIEDFRSHRSSGIAHLVVRLEDGHRTLVACENGPTVRALDACFGGVIGPGMTVQVDAIRGKQIEFSRDDIGLMKWFEPVEE